MRDWGGWQLPNKQWRSSDSYLSQVTHWTPVEETGGRRCRLRNVEPEEEVEEEKEQEEENNNKNKNKKNENKEKKRR
ncbi:hypothetical protein E2C01_022318 [Portunus trituberculatus]|uniref:Uncharacterized protein n=1 Tax=Portunus trituberculatus TaxID=210409 RepID=A0A5B7E518_PORTR|nr:hypothetical protein [Portunus trituberculatus]